MYQLPTADEFFSDDYQLPTADEFFDMSPDETSGQDQTADATPGNDPGATGGDPTANPSPADAGQAGQTVPCPDETAINVNDPNVQGAHIYAYKDPHDPKGFSFFAVDDKGSEPVTGYFNRTTYANYDELLPGDYTLSPRPHIAVKTGLAGAGQYVNQFRTGNSSGDPNKHEGNPAISNSDDWNTIILPNGHKMTGSEIHPGKDSITGEGYMTMPPLPDTDGRIIYHSSL